jgi:hypothetical protein
MYSVNFRNFNCGKKAARQRFNGHTISCRAEAHQIIIDTASLPWPADSADVTEGTGTFSDSPPAILCSAIPICHHSCSVNLHLCNLRDLWLKKRPLIRTDSREFAGKLIFFSLAQDAKPFQIFRNFGGI